MSIAHEVYTPDESYYHEVYTDEYAPAPITERLTQAAPTPRPSGLILLIGGLVALGIALAHIGGATQIQAVAWAVVVAAVLAGLRKWA